MRRVTVLIMFVCLFKQNLVSQIQQAKSSDRQLWLSYLDKIARPILSNIAEKNARCFIKED